MLIITFSVLSNDLQPKKLNNVANNYTSCNNVTATATILITTVTKVTGPLSLATPAIFQQYMERALMVSASISITSWLQVQHWKNTYTTTRKTCDDW